MRELTKKQEERMRARKARSVEPRPRTVALPLTVGEPSAGYFQIHVEMRT